MVNNVFDIPAIFGARDNLAVNISNTYILLEQYRYTWMRQTADLRNYLFATDTSTTQNKILPWKNSTTVPKLTQIRDNLHANYMEALFPNKDWLTWEGHDEDAALAAKRVAIEDYMRTKLRQDNAEVVVSQLLLDWIDYGNCFMTAEWVDDSWTRQAPAQTMNDILNPKQRGEVVRGYVGPRIVRVSPYDIVFNPIADSFEKSPKIIRKLTTLGELTKAALKLDPASDERVMLLHALQQSTVARRTVRGLNKGDIIKGEGLIFDGFSSIQHYLGTDYVEVLTFYGDMYDMATGEFYENHVITVMDRSYLVSKKPNPNWTNTSGIFHTSWRQRPDNLYGQGPLDNLVGMQYRIDHLENLKADVFDMVAYPVLKIKGFVEDFDYQPGARIVVGDEGDVEFMHPDTTALNADTQIAELERRMEELAGAPKEAMGIRTPGEKTKFEVQKLDNAASRIFQNKIEHFEKTGLEKLLNYMLQLARRNMSGTDVIRTLDSEVDAVIFSTITKEDITANGLLRPVGAEHFAERANSLQNLIGVLNTPAYSDPAVSVNWSGKALAKAMATLADLDQFKVYGDNVRVLETAATQRLQAQAQEQAQVAAATPPGISEGDPATKQAGVAGIKQPPPILPSGSDPASARAQYLDARKSFENIEEK